MSNCKTIETELEALINTLLPAYTVYKDWTEKGFPEKFGIELAANYSNQTITTDNSKKIAYSVTLYMYREYTEIQSDTTDKVSQKEQLRIDFEKLIKRQDIELVAGQTIVCYDSVNDKQKCKVIEFNIIYQ